MIPRRKMSLSKLVFLLLVLAASSTNQLALSSTIEPRTNNSGSSSSNNNRRRWLTYGCNSKDDGGRTRLLSRILTHPCNSTPNKSTSANDLYNHNTTTTTTATSSFVIVTLGIIAGVLTILGMLYIIDRETFTLITGVKELGSHGCSKPQIDDGDEDEDSATPYERDNQSTPYERDNRYLTEETVNYLEEKRDKEVEQPKRRLRSIFHCCFRTKDYGDENTDKYHIPWTGSDDDEGNKGNVNIIMVLFEEIRLRLCWRPTKEYDEKDKYDVEAGDGEENREIKFAASSYESAEV